MSADQKIPTNVHQDQKVSWKCCGKIGSLLQIDHFAFGTMFSRFIIRELRSWGKVFKCKTTFLCSDFNKILYFRSDYKNDYICMSFNVKMTDIVILNTKMHFLTSVCVDLKPLPNYQVIYYPSLNDTFLTLPN